MTTSKEKAQLISSKKIIEFSAYVKIEKNGLEIKNKLLTQNTISYVIITENKYKLADTTNSLNVVEVRNKNRDFIFGCKVKEIIRCIDRFIAEGKLTLMATKEKDRYSIFISKSTKELLDAFIEKLFVKPEEKKTNPKPTQKSSDYPLTIVNKKRKFHELYQNKHGFVLKKQIPVDKNFNITKSEPQYRFDQFPNYLLYLIFEYLDKKSLFTKVALLNKDLKKSSDAYVERLTIRDDTPSSAFNKILSRFQNTKYLSFGRGKNFKNEIIRNLTSSLRSLEILDISHIENINDASIKKLLSKTTVLKLKKISVNFNVESLYTCLIYLLQFCKGLQSLNIQSNKLDFSQKTLDYLAKFPRIYRKEIFNTITHILMSADHTELSEFNTFLFNSMNIYEKGVFKNLTTLHIDMLMIEKVKNLQILYNCDRLVNLKLSTIVIKEVFENPQTRSNEVKFNYINFSSEVQKANSNEEAPTEEMLEALSIDFENDYLEVFGKIFYYMSTNLRSISLGNFVNDELCSLIGGYLKNITYLDISSDQITDEGIKVILFSCKQITEVDLSDCTRFLGNAFFDTEIPSLKKSRTSITTHNFYHVINFLRSKGIQADNYIKYSNNFN